MLQDNKDNHVKEEKDVFKKEDIKHKEIVKQPSTSFEDRFGNVI